MEGELIRTRNGMPVLLVAPQHLQVYRLLLYTDVPSTQASVIFYVNNYKQSYFKNFTINQAHVWHIFDFYPSPQKVWIAAPVAQLKTYVNHVIRRIKLNSDHIVDWVLCDYSCSLPALASPCPTTSTNTTTTAHITTTSTFNIILGVMCSVFILTTLTLSLYICFSNNNQHLTNPPLPAHVASPAEPAMCMKQEYYGEACVNHSSSHESERSLCGITLHRESEWSNDHQL
ncbi:uncharacterized protein LOC121876637 isoform X2 [Homarus americanus]|uniref:uncharacterized protein LOC121876637 isoform X2 n=1 Tax=Homarus americanus TaxID=6706 RepID=UPI001C45C79D|nr:uncharacterized protein LOC121876637 isoform X2 [Homarus americanus]